MINWKKMTALMTTGILLATAAGCQSKNSFQGADIDIEDVIEDTEETAEPEKSTEVVSDLEARISWWTYPIFVEDEEQGDGSYEQSLIQKFNEKYPNITVEVKYLDYTDGPKQLEEQIKAEGGELPNVLLDEPGRISTYAKEGLLSDLSDLFTEDVIADMVSPGIISACQSGDAYVMYPLSGSNYVMAFNRSMLEESGAMELLNQEEARTWTTEAFEQVITKLHDAGFNAGMLYCSGIAGDYATRSFITNLYDGSLMNEDMTSYTVNSEAGQKALSKIKSWMDGGLLLNGTDSSGADAVSSFVAGNNSYCLLWSLPQAISNAEALQENGVDVVVMPYPAEDGTPSLEYMLNGFCIFKTEDEQKEQASRYLIDFLCNDESVAQENVVRSGAFPVRSSMGDVYGGNEEASLYEALMPYSGPYYQKVNGFEEMRVYWYQMETEILDGEYSVKEAANSFVEYANKTLTQKKEQ